MFLASLFAGGVYSRGSAGWPTYPRTLTAYLGYVDPSEIRLNKPRSLVWGWLAGGGVRLQQDLVRLARGIHLEEFGTKVAGATTLVRSLLLGCYIDVNSDWSAIQAEGESAKVPLERYTHAGSLMAARVRFLFFKGNWVDLGAGDM